MKLIYVASPLAGDVTHNIEFANRACRTVMDSGHAFFAPHLLYPSILNDSVPAERKLGMDMGLAVLTKCDELWAFGDRVSEGMKAEIKEAERLGIPVRQMGMSILSEREDILKTVEALGGKPLTADPDQYTFGSTGGGCMAGTGIYHVPELGRKIWVNCGDDGVSVAMADYVWDADRHGSWKRRDDVELLDLSYREDSPEKLGSWPPLVKDCLVYTISTQIKDGYRDFQIPARWLPEQYREEMDRDQLTAALEQNAEVVISQDAESEEITVVRACQSQSPGTMEMR